jgi:hypothetical protein
VFVCVQKRGGEKIKKFVVSAVVSFERIHRETRESKQKKTALEARRVVRSRALF